MGRARVRVKVTLQVLGCIQALALCPSMWSMDVRTVQRQAQRHRPWVGASWATCRRRQSR